MPEVKPGHHKYRHSDTVTHELGSASAVRGDAMAIGADGTAVTTTGGNGFLGVLQSATEADVDAGNLAPGAEYEDVYGSGDGASVALRGVVRAKVSGTVDSDGDGTNEPVSAGDKLVAGSAGALENVGDGTTNPSPVTAGVDETKALGDEDADGFAIVDLR